METGAGRRAVFLEREGYRRRRLRDALRLLPVLGAGLWLVPMLWTSGDVALSTAFLYVFAVWLVLIILSALLTARLPEGDLPGPDAPDAPADPLQG